MTYGPGLWSSQLRGPLSLCYTGASLQGVFTVIKAGIIGATGYFGLELVRLLARHPHVTLAGVYSRTYAGQRFSDVYPHLAGQFDQDIVAFEPELAEGLDVLFLCTPHGVAARTVPQAIEYGTVCIDVSADFRLKDAAVYEKWYKTEHTSPELLAQAIYGLPELYGEQIKSANIIGNPGCYPTSVLLALLPALQAGLVDLEAIVVDSKSGVSGAGRTKLDLMYHFPECNDNLTPYGVKGHRHVSEINQTLSEVAGSDIKISFTPHLIPMTRGILSSVYLFPTSELTPESVQGLYEDYYTDKPFVRVMPASKLPCTKQVQGTNFCDLGLTVTGYAARPMLVVHSAIDNLVKGAAGQAVQNMNLRFGLPETAGLDQLGLYP